MIKRPSLRNLAAISLFLILGGCVSSTGNPWDRYHYTRQAEAAPNSLSTPVSNERSAEQILSYPGDTPAEEQKVAGLRITGMDDDTSSDQDYMERTRSYENPPLEATPIAPSGPKVNVAILLPLSGEHADLGQSMLQAAQLALFDLNPSNFNLMPRDTKGTPEGARSAAQSAADSGAQLVLGPLFSSSVRAAEPILSRRNINMLAFSTDWSLADTDTFIMGFLPFAQVQRITQYAFSQGYQNIAILAPNTDYGNAVIASYNSLAYRMGLNTADVVRFPVQEGDISGIIRSFTHYDERVENLNQQVRALESRLKSNPGDSKTKSQLAKYKTMDVLGDLPFDAILLPVGGEKARSVVNLLTYYGIDTNETKLLGTGLWDDPGLTAEPGMVGAWFSAPSPNSREDFMQRYRETFGQSPQRLATLAYDATAMSVILSQSGLRTRGRPAFDRNTLLNPNGFSGVDGIFRFRPDGLIERGLAVLEIRNRDMVIIEDAPRTFQQTSPNTANR